jgi:hypothetical protein
MMSDPVEAVARDKAKWLLDAIATATQDRRLLKDDPQADEVMIEAIEANGAKAIRLAIAAYHEALEADGWQVVPKEPTNEMWQAGDRQFDHFDIGERIVHPVYLAMLSAAPTPKERDHE